MTVDHDIRVIGFDLDGTLLKDDKTISEHTRTVLKKATDKGIHVLPATGRGCLGIPDFLRNMEGIRYGICSNGAAVIDFETGEEIYSCRISHENAMKMLDIMMKYNTMYDAYIDGKGYLEERFYVRLDQYGIENEIKQVVERTREVIDSLRTFLLDGEKQVEKFNMFFSNPEDRQKAWDEITKLPFVKVTSSLYNNIEINAADCNKGTALTGFARKFGYTSEQIMGFGDGNNDYDMIVMSGVGVAMKNAIDILKEVADYITDTNEEDGVAKAIEYFCFLE